MAVTLDWKSEKKKRCGQGAAGKRHVGISAWHVHRNHSLDALPVGHDAEEKARESVGSNSSNIRAETTLLLQRVGSPQTRTSGNSAIAQAVFDLGVEICMDSARRQGRVMACRDPSSVD